MLLTQLHESITRKAKNVDELQKLIDVSGSTGIEAISADTVEIVSTDVHLQNLITPGQLPFKFKEGVYPNATLRVSVPTLRTFKGLEKLSVDNFVIGSTSGQATDSIGTKKVIPSKITSLAHMPQVTGHVDLYHMLELKTLEGLNVSGNASDTRLMLYNLPLISSLAPAKNITKIVLQECENLTFKDFPADCTKLDIRYITIKRGAPWFITIPKHCTVQLDDINVLFAPHKIPEALAAKLIRYQREGLNSKAKMLEIQADLVDADLDDLAEL